MRKIHKLVAASTAATLTAGMAVFGSSSAFGVDLIQIPSVDAPTEITTKNVIDAPGYDTVTQREHGAPLGDGSLICVVDKPIYNIGYTGHLDMTNVVFAWNELKKNGNDKALERSKVFLWELNNAITRFQPIAAAQGVTIKNIVWDGSATAEADAKTTLEQLVQYGAEIKATMPAGNQQDRFQQLLDDDTFRNAFVSEQANKNWWLEVFYRLKVASDFVISWKVDPSVVDVDIDLWNQKIDEAYRAGNTHTTFDDYMRPYKVAYDKTTGVVETYFRVKVTDTATDYNDPADATTLNGQASYDASNRDVFARELDLAYNGGDHIYGNGNDLAFLEITTPAGVLTVSEENYRKVEGLDPLSVRSFIASDPRVVGDFRLPISDNADAQAAMSEMWRDTWRIGFDQTTNNAITYWTETDVTIDHSFASAAKDAAGNVIPLPAEVSALLPARVTNQLLDNAKVYAPAAPAKTEVATKDGKWIFQGWDSGTPVQWTTHQAVDAANEFQTAANVTDCKVRAFVGTWNFEKKPVPPTPELKPIVPAKPELAKTGADVAVLSLVAISALGVGVVARRRNS